MRKYGYEGRALSKGLFVLCWSILATESCSVDCQHGNSNGGSGGASASGGGGGKVPSSAGASGGGDVGGADSSVAGAAGSGEGGTNGGDTSLGSGGVPEAGGAAGQPGEASAGEAGAGGASAECTPSATRSCLDGGALGACAAGKQTCTTSVTWGPCSIVPSAADTCEQGNDANCNGALNEGCPCLKGATRSCADAGLVGKCANGTQTCTDKGAWGACSITPASEDTCEKGNNDNCSGAANEGCSCILGTPRACGACQDGTQTCSNGKTGQYTTCAGAVLVPTTYYRDADGDGFGSAASTTVCTSTPPTGYTDQTGDCCDDGGNLTLAAKIHPGQTEWFQAAANLCGVTWDYDCSKKVDLKQTEIQSGCAVGTTAPTCATALAPLSETTCGTSLSVYICYSYTPGGPGAVPQCAQTGNSGGMQGCH
ncbi:MAG: hypothetical protein QM756_03245 [Polyangiaceae bacterium]